MSAPEERAGQWSFWVDRGGTFTDVIGVDPQGRLHARKLLSIDPARRTDATLAGIADLLGASRDAPLPAERIRELRVGTTVGTNALLEQKGEPVALFITRGFRDALRIGYQNRPDIFAREIKLPRPLYSFVQEIDERLLSNGAVLHPLNESSARLALERARAKGLRACAIVLLFSFRNPAHELRLAELARAAGFSEISLSHRASPLIKLVRRGDTAVLDAHLSPPVRAYADTLQSALPGVPILFMQSNGGLTPAAAFRGKDSLLSGPAGGVNGGVAVGRRCQRTRLIGFDMGGTSTDVWRSEGELERREEYEIAGVRLQNPALEIHTVAAGGGSILGVVDGRLCVGPESAGADPGPRCYGRGGPLTVTDANALLGRIQADFFPNIAGPSGALPLAVRDLEADFRALARALPPAAPDERALEAEELAAGFLRVAVQSMAQAVRRISLQRGRDPADHVLLSFGGAGGQHACALADELDISEILIDPFAGVLSAYGMGQAQLSAIEERYIGAPLADADAAELEAHWRELQAAIPARLGVGADAEVHFTRSVQLRYAGADASLAVACDNARAMQDAFESAHRRLFGFLRPDATLTIDRLELEGRLPAPASVEALRSPAGRDAPTTTEAAARAETLRPVHDGARWRDTPVFRRADLAHGMQLEGPALVVSEGDTVYLAPDWSARVESGGVLRLTRRAARIRDRAAAHGERLGLPVKLTLFHNLFQSIAEEMGAALQRTSFSVNIKERLDFSCALFDERGRLVANAPHIPVHLGSMGDSVAAVLRVAGPALRPGDAYILNNPYDGGTHLPDITVVTPVFVGEELRPRFFCAARGHHADVGGVTPGSMPANSRSIHEEGVLIEATLVRRDGQLLEAAARALFSAGPYPARDVERNLSDLAAQLAANERGLALLQELAMRYGADEVTSMMRACETNAADAVRRRLKRLRSGAVDLDLDGGRRIQLTVAVDSNGERIRFDFAGSSPQDPGNFNAPASVVRAAILYALRVLVAEPIPLNAGFLEPVDLALPEDCFLNPRFPAAVVAGNVETSQAVVDAIFLALGEMAASQGTMNNLSFGDANLQYYETIAGGSGAGPDFSGCSAVQTHMTNSRLTDPEVLEERFPVLLEEFSIRAGSGGVGRHPGGDGVVRRIRFHKPMQASILSSNRQRAPRGLAGGDDGAPGLNRWLKRDGEIVALDSCAEFMAEAGDAVEIATPGGGAYGASASHEL